MPATPDPAPKASGWFVADGNVAGLVPVDGSALPGLTALGEFHFEGPVTCLDVRGNRAGLIYPIAVAEGSPLAQSAKGQAIHVTIVDHGPGNPDAVGFAGPAPINDLHTCPPTVGLLRSASGNVRVRDAG